MNTTPVSLLEKLRQPNPQDAWTRFVHLYSPLLAHWVHDLGLAGADADDFLQDLFLLLLQKLPKFQYHRDKRFRGWLWTVVLNKYRERRRASVEGKSCPLDGQAEPAVPDTLDAAREREYQHYIVRRALELMQSNFQPATWKAFWESTLNERPVAEVASELGMSVASVYAARSRVLRLLRTEFAELLD